MTHTIAGKYILGIDLGSASIGWSLIQLDDSEAPVGLLADSQADEHALPACGARLFEPGVEGTAAEILEGKDQSKAVERRTARLHRRQLRRRVGRQVELFALLQRQGLLPVPETDARIGKSERRSAILADIDQALQKKKQQVDAAFVQLPLYKLRKAALDERLDPVEIGRVLYHLSQRRGFLSNRKEGGKTPDAEKELGKVKSGIAEIKAKMEAAGARTLGEYFAGLDPHQSGQQVRRQWTAREWYKDEFRQIWESQLRFHPSLLTEDLRREVERLLFFQRPIAAQAHLIGKCELEGANHRRAPWASIAAQRFRVLQKVNDLRVIFPGNPDALPLSVEQRQILFHLLDCEGDMTFKAIRKALHLDAKSQFNLEKGGESRLRGNRTYKAMLSVFKDRWAGFSAEEQEQIVEDWRTIELPGSLMRRGREDWGLDEAAAQEWARLQPEDGHCALSRRAIGRLLPRMVEGESFKEVETAIYGHRFSGGVALDRLPPLRVNRKVAGAAELEATLQKLRLGAIRNPAVERALTELRKLVNAIVRVHGKPYEIRVELARELKMPRQKRVAAAKNMRDREKERSKVKADLLRECGIQNPSRRDIEKALLQEECGGICPYTGKTINLASLFGEHPQFDVEHILPLSRFPDDSFQNKTLCWHEENRSVKRNRTPFEAYGGDPERWDEMLARVRAWKPGNAEKLRRFQLRSSEEVNDFTARQMNDTRYASVLACRLLESLYGGRDVVTEQGTRQVIFASSGKVTATLRRSWGLEKILGEAQPTTNGKKQGKSRADHRHHAIDAITIALTRQSVIQAMSRAAQFDPWPQQSARSYRSLQAPWNDFVASIRPYIEGLLVSHRPEHKMSGPLHDETNYGPQPSVGGKGIVHIRKQVSGLKEGDIENIVDDAVRQAVQEKAAALGGDLSRCESGNDWPALKARDGRLIPIKRVRLRKTLNVTPIGAGPRQRHVAIANNHHVAIFARLDERGREKRWESIPVSLFEAMERKRRKLPIVQRSYPEAASEGAEWVFRFSLMGGDTVELHRGCDHAREICRPEIYRLRSIASGGPLSLVRVNDARLKKDIKDVKEWWSPGADALRKMDCRKVVVDLLGTVRPARD